jgi:4-aminobutyrate aminotransferase-like enzyme/Ser/Thr protein kinase RdoA (MazF antagonist)
MQIEEILHIFFNLEDCTLTQLLGYGSTNYKVECPAGIFVLKRYAQSSATVKMLRAEHRVLSVLQKHQNIITPIPLTTNTDDQLVMVEGYIYRILHFMEGKFFGEITHTSALMYSMGEFLANLDVMLESVQEEAIAAKEICWDLKHFSKNRPLIKYISNPEKRSLVHYFFMQFEQCVGPKTYSFRKRIIHNDANDWNVLTDGKKVSGIIDFGDMCHTWLVSEVAIGMTYAMMNKENPLVMGAEVLRGYVSILPLEVEEIEALYYLIAARLCVSVCQSAYTSSMSDSSPYITISEKGAWKLLTQWLAIHPDKATNVFRNSAGLPNTYQNRTADILINRKKQFAENLSLSYQKPIHMVRSAFQYMYDAEGNTYLDAYNNIMLVGHCHPKVVSAGQKSMARLNTNTRYLYEALEDYGTALLKKFPPALNKVFLVNSGSEASDLALRMARYHTRKKKVAVLEHGYHGHTQAGMDISSYKFNHKGAGGKPSETLELPIPKAFGTSFPDDGTAGQAYAENALAHLREHHGKIAAFIAEPIVGCGGQVPLALGYLNAIYPEIRAQGGVCISDEVQVGFGRLGEVFWGYELYDVIPDIVILGKPMGNGHPMGAVVTTAEIAESFGEGPEFFSSFGGNPVSCAIGLAVLEVLEEEKRQEHSKITGEYLKREMGKLREKHASVGDVRGHGLFLGVELVSPDGVPLTELASHLANTLREQYVLVSTDGPYNHVIKIKPPLTFDQANADELVSKMDTILARNMVFR